MVDSSSPIQKISSVAQNIDDVEIRPSYFHNHSTQNIMPGSQLHHYLAQNDSQSSSLSDASNYEGGIFQSRIYDATLKDPNLSQFSVKKFKPVLMAKLFENKNKRRLPYINKLVLPTPTQVRLDNLNEEKKDQKIQSNNSPELLNRKLSSKYSDYSEEFLREQTNLTPENPRRVVNMSMTSENKEISLGASFEELEYSQDYFLSEEYSSNASRIQTGQRGGVLQSQSYSARKGMSPVVVDQRFLKKPQKLNMITFPINLQNIPIKMANRQMRAERKGFMGNKQRQKEVTKDFVKVYDNSQFSKTQVTGQSTARSLIKK